MFLDSIALLAFSGDSSVDPNLLYGSSEGLICDGAKSVYYKKITLINNTAFSKITAPDPVNNEIGNLFKDGKARLAKTLHQVKNALNTTIPEAHFGKSYQNFKDNIVPQNSIYNKKIQAAVDGYHSRMACAKVYKKVYNSHDGKDLEDVFSKWREQESRTYIGASINKKLDKFICDEKEAFISLCNEYTKNSQSGSMDEHTQSPNPRNTWSNEIFARLIKHSQDQRKDDIHKLANPTICDTVFEYFYSLDNEADEKDDYKIPASVWKISDLVYARIFPHLPSPKDIVEECDDYLKTPQQSNQPMNVEPQTESTEIPPRPSFDEKSLQRYTSTAFQRFADTMLQ